MFENPEIWINGGLSAVSLALILLIVVILNIGYKAGNNFTSMMSKHMESSDKTLQENAKAMNNMSRSLDNNTKALSDNTRILARVEHTLDRQ